MPASPAALALAPAAPSARPALALVHPVATGTAPPPAVHEAIDASRHLTGLSRTCRRRVQRRVAQVSELVDTLRARRTVPRGPDARQWDARPGVDLDVWRLHVAYARSRSEDDLRALVEEYEQYALSLARRLRREGEPNDDLDQVAREALVVALTRFDCSRGVPFPALATPTILGALRRHYRDHGWGMRVPRRVHELSAPAREASDRLTTALGRTPRSDEVATELGVPTAELVATRAAEAARTPSSLDTLPGGEATGLHELLGATDGELLRAEQLVSLRQGIAHLDDRDRTVLGMYFFEERSQRQIAAHLGVSQMQVSRWLTRILARLRSRMEC